MNIRKVLTIACALVLVVTLATGATLAYFHDEETKVNHFTGAGNDPSNPDQGLDIDVEEPEWEKNPDKGLNTVPGDVLTKDPTIVNKKGPAYARIIVSFVDKKTGDVITDKPRADKIYSMLYYMTSSTAPEKMDSTELSKLSRVNPEFTLDTAAGRSSTGVYYFNYNTIMEYNTKATLFKGVAVPTDWDQDDIAAIGDFDIVVEGQAIQAANFADSAEAFTALDGETSK